jgi:hypothetical protein
MGKSHPIRQPASWPIADAELVRKLESVVASKQRARTLSRTEVSIVNEVTATSTTFLLACYRHPVHDFYHWSAEAPRDELIRLLREQFDAERGRGLDLIVAIPDLSTIWIGNHDGDQFRLQ